MATVGFCPQKKRTAAWRFFYARDLTRERQATQWMSEENESNHIRLSPSVFLALIGAIGLGSAGVSGVVAPARDNQQLAAVEKDVRELRAQIDSSWTGKEHDGYARSIEDRIFRIEREIIEIKREIEHQ
jgi:hypothetical protein